MTAPVYERLLAVQDLDVKLTQLRHRHANHSLRGEISDTDAAIAVIDETGTEIAGRKAVFDKQNAELDAEVTTIRARRAEIEGKLYDGSVTGTKDLLALQEESAMLLERRNGTEDEELEIMEQIETITRELQAVADERSAKVTAKEKLQAELDTVLVAIEAEIVDVEAQRVAAAAEVPAGLLDTYEGLREDFGGIAVARLSGSTCDGCHMSLSAVSLDKAKKLPEDAVVTCDQCGRLLVR